MGEFDEISYGKAKAALELANSLAGAGRTTETVKENADTLANMAKQQKNFLGYGMKNYNSRIGKSFEAFENAADWALYPNTTAEANTSEFKRGSQAIKLSATAVATEAAMTKTISTYIGDSNRQFRLWVYCHDPITSISELIIYLSSTTDFAKNFNYGAKAQILRQGWNLVVIQPGDWTNVGGESWENKFLRLRIRIVPVAEQTLSMTFDALDYDAKSEPRILITFDDGLSSLYTAAYPIMEAVGLKGVSYVNSSTIGNAGNMSLAQLHELYADGWDIGNHGDKHIDYLTKTEAEILADIVDGQNYLLANGFIKSAKHFAIPNGAYDADVAAAIASSGVTTVRSSATAIFYPEAYSILYLPTEYIVNTTTLANVIAWIETAISKGQTLILMFHAIVETATTTYQWSIANFQALINFIVARNVPVVTMSEWYDGLNLVV
jgi:peptidoglycan/xylan/chitin deacetylase (PgdA/CDA1 family)